MARLRLRSSRPARKAAPRAHSEPHLSVVPAKVDHVGLILREGREHFGANLRDVADTLRIRYVYLQAIEEGSFDDLPGPTYAIGFVRAYSDFLGFDTESLLERLRAETQGLERPAQLDFPTAPTEARFPGGGALLVSLIIAGGVFGGWYYTQSQDEFHLERMPAAIVDAIAGRFGGAETPEATVPMPGAPNEGAGDEFAAVYDLGRAAPGPDPQNPNAVPAPEAAATPELETPPAAAAQLPPVPAPVAALPIIEPVVPGAEQAPVAAASVAGNRVLPPAGVAAEPVAGANVPVDDLDLLAANDPAAPKIDMAEPEPVGPATPNIVFISPPKADPAAPNLDADVDIAGLPAEVGLAPEAADVDAPVALVRPNAPAAEGAADPIEGAAAPAENAIAALPAVPRGAGNTSTGRVYGSTNRNSRIVIFAEVDSWIQVRDSSRTDVFTRMLRAGDSYRVPNDGGLILMTGNAGGLKIGIDGEAARALGDSGEVARDVPLDPDLLRSRYLR